MTARQIIENRIGKPLPATRDMTPDQRQAVKLLAIQLLRNACIREGGEYPCNAH